MIFSISFKGMLSAWQIVQQFSLFSAALRPQPSSQFSQRREEKSVKRKSHKNEQESPLAAQIKNRVLCVATWRLTHSLPPNETHSVETKRSQKMCCNSEDDDDDRESGWWPGVETAHSAHTVSPSTVERGRKKGERDGIKSAERIPITDEGASQSELTWNMEKMLSMNLFMLIGETNSCSNIAHFSWFALLPDPVAEREWNVVNCLFSVWPSSLVC